MKIRIVMLIFFLNVTLVLSSSSSMAETVSLSTYYPAPFGAYDRLKLVPRDSLALDPHCNDPKDVGTMYFNAGLKDLNSGVYVCQVKSEKIYFFTYLGAPTITGKGKMEDGKLVCLKKDGQLGVCYSSPSFDGTCACQ